MTSKESPPPTAVTADELQDAFDYFNEELWSGKLPACLLTLQRERHTYGYLSWNRFVRHDGREFAAELALNAAYFVTRTLKETLATLVHEQAHLYQEAFGHHKSVNGYHNKEWVGFMRLVGLIPSDTGQPGGKQVGFKMSHYVEAGGRFDRAADKLISERGFRISWLDRIAMAVPPELELPPDYAPPTPEELHGALPSPVFTPPVLSVEEVGFDEEIGARVALLSAAVSEPAGRPDVRKLPEPQYRGAAERVEWPQDSRAKETRWKYRCPGCMAQVWGKPRLDILCGSCGGRAYEHVEWTRGYGARPARTGEPHEAATPRRKLAKA